MREEFLRCQHSWILHCSSTARAVLSRPQHLRRKVGQRPHVKLVGNMRSFVSLSSGWLSRRCVLDQRHAGDTTTGVSQTHAEKHLLSILLLDPPVEARKESHRREGAKVARRCRRGGCKQMSAFRRGEARTTWNSCDLFSTKSAPESTPLRTDAGRAKERCWPRKFSRRKGRPVRLSILRRQDHRHNRGAERERENEIGGRGS